MKTLMLSVALTIGGCASLTPQDFVGTWVFGNDAVVSGLCNGAPTVNPLTGQQRVFALNEVAGLILVQPTCTLEYSVIGTEATLLANQRCAGQGAAQTYELRDTFELTGEGLLEKISGTVTFSAHVCTEIRGGGTLTKLLSK